MLSNAEPMPVHPSLARCRYRTQPQAQWRAALLLYVFFLSLCDVFFLIPRIRRYLDKGADTVEGSKPYAKVLRLLASLGIRI